MARRVLPIFPTSLLAATPLRERAQAARTLKVPDLHHARHARRDHPVRHVRSASRGVAGDRDVDTMSIDDADHNDLFEVGGPELSARIKRFLDGLPPRGTAELSLPRRSR